MANSKMGQINVNCVIKGLQSISLLSKGALCGFEEEVQTLISNIYSIHEVNIIVPHPSIIVQEWEWEHFSSELTWTCYHLCKPPSCAFVFLQRLFLPRDNDWWAPWQVPGVCPGSHLCRCQYKSFCGKVGLKLISFQSNNTFLSCGFHMSRVLQELGLAGDLKTASFLFVTITNTKSPYSYCHTHSSSAVFPCSHLKCWWTFGHLRFLLWSHSNLTAKHLFSLEQNKIIPELW